MAEIATDAITQSAPVSYAPGSEYVYSSSGKRVGSLGGSGIGTQFNTVKDQVFGGTNVFFAWTPIPNQAGSGGSVSATFILTGTPTSSHQYFGHGNLFKVANKYPTGLTAVRDAAATSGYLEPKPAAPTPLPRKR
jgi:hypothetical protein